MGVISVIAGIATVILLYCSIIITNLKGFEKGKKFLFIALIPLIICFVCKTEDVEMTMRFIFGVAMLYPIVGSLCIFISKEDRAFGFVNLISLVLCVIMLLASGMSFSSGFSSGGSGRKCVFCEKRTATHGTYCSQCYDATHPD